MRGLRFIFKLGETVLQQLDLDISKPKDFLNSPCSDRMTTNKLMRTKAELKTRFKTLGKTKYHSGSTQSCCHSSAHQHWTLQLPGRQASSTI